MGFYTPEQLKKIPFKSVGVDVKISTTAAIYAPERISIGDHSRIDDFCVLSAGAGGIEIGRYVHIAVYSCLIGQGKIIMKDFSGLSSRVSVYSSSDDYSGKGLTNPTIPQEYRSVITKDVILEKHAVVGAGAVILPGVTLREGAAVGALALVVKDCESFFIYAGTPARKVNVRSRELLDKERMLKS